MTDTSTTLADALADLDRLERLAETGLMDSPATESFDRLTQLVQGLLGVPVALVSLVDDHRQFFKSAQGLPEPWATLRETPLTHSFCQHVVATQKPLVIEDARDHPVVCDNLAIPDLNVIGYLGIPLVTPEGYVLGSLCAIEGEPRAWSESDVKALTDLTELVMTEIKLTHELRLRQQAEEALRKKAAALERSNSDLEAFAYVASHDLQEPLRTIRSFVSLLHERYGKEADEEADEFVGFIVDATTRMQAQIRALLTFSRMGTRPLDRLPNDLEMELGVVLDLLRVAIDECEAVITQDPLPTVLCDAVQIRAVFQNLISNALKFKGTEPTRIHVGYTAQEGFGQFSVSDNGIGIKPAFQERIFQVFRRLHRHETYEGTGIGLSICKKVVERHGGKIWVTSAPGHGSTFYFTLPLQA